MEVNEFENISQQESRQFSFGGLFCCCCFGLVFLVFLTVLRGSEFCQFANTIKTDDVLFLFLRTYHKIFNCFSSPQPSVT
jgi:hypothetical protein